MTSEFSFSSGARFVNTTVQRSSHHALVVMFLTTALMGGCIFRLVQLQIVQGQYHRQQAEQNRLRFAPIVSDRGNITDRTGQLLAANRLSRSVYIWPREQSPTQWQITAKQLSGLLQIPKGEILRKLEQAGYRSTMPVRIMRDLTATQFVSLTEQATQFPGIEIRAESSRYYPTGDLAAHVLGYIGEATADDLKENPQYPMGMIVGQMGVERMAETQLQGVWGSRLIEVDARGKELQMVGTRPPKSGEPVQLTLDLALQKTAEKALGKRRGSVVVLNVKTGAVLVLTSGPTFDPNLFTHKITQSQWQQLQNQDKPFLNRAFQGYPPGSTFKLVTAVAGMESGKLSPNSTLATSAYITVGGTQFNEHGSGYGVIGFREAFAYSSNTFFYQVGLLAGPEEIAKWSRRLGVGHVSILGMEKSNRGSVPTPKEKEKLYDEPWYAGDTVSMAIGQGLVQVTPLELAVIYATIANGGWRVQPHLLASQTHTAATQRQPTGLNPATIATVRSGLIAVVQQGTASQLNDGSIPQTAGKTGTAEVLGQPDNAVYVGFGPVNDPQIAIAVVVENGGFGAVSAVPIAHEVYKTYFKAVPKLPSK